jgi:Flp pilus assembly protein TadG
MADTASPEARGTHRRTQRGAATVEMALVLPVYLALCWGIIVFSFILFGFCNATYASRVAVRYAAFHGSSSHSPCTTAQVQAIATQYLFGAPKNGFTVTPSWPNGSDIYDWATVTITITYPTGIPYFSLKSVTVGATATEMIME